MYLDFLHFVKRHIAQFPTVAHRNRTEADTGLWVILQEVSRVSSHWEEVTGVGNFIANKFFFRTVQLGQLLPDTVGHQVVGIVYILVFSFLPVCFCFQLCSDTQLLQLFLRFCLPLFFCHRYACLIEFSVKALLKFQGELCPYILRHIVNATIEVILPCRLAVWVLAHRAFGGNGSVGYVLPFTVKE